MSIYPYETKQGKTLYRVHLQPVRRGPQFTKRGFRKTSVLPFVLTSSVCVKDTLS